MKLINENLILLDMNLQSKDDIISCIADTLENNQRLCDKQQYIDDVYSREDEISTAMGSSIAIPHALSLGVRHTSLVFLRLQNPIQWDDDQVQMVFGIAVRKENSGNEHLRILSNLARKLMDLQMRFFIQTIRTAVCSCWKNAALAEDKTTALHVT